MRIMLIMNHMPLCTGLNIHAPSHSPHITRPLRRHLSPQPSRSTPTLRRKPTEHIIGILILSQPPFPIVILIILSGHHVLISPASRANLMQLEVVRYVDSGRACPIRMVAVGAQLLDITWLLVG